MPDVLLDTHIFIWIMNGDETLSPHTRKLIKNTCKQHCLLIASISIWEIAMLQSKGKISLTQPLGQWVKKVASLPYMKIIPLTPEIAIESCALPGDFHGDPADRMIVATSRILDVSLMTRDQKILEYGHHSYIKVIAC
ncbi:MAG: type II toxin-antitoxin system VapC family toxin [Alphaproteobacteria bacterium]|nr:type II toxin-antitoxin system VapC family toxin [Alphaproteobacteria bacterium]